MEFKNLDRLLDAGCGVSVSSVEGGYVASVFTGERKDEVGIFGTTSLDALEGLEREMSWYTLSGGRLVKDGDRV